MPPWVVLGRDEEKVRAKERFFHIEMSSSSNGIQKKSRPELWNLFNGRKKFMNIVSVSYS
jgi:sulfate adenylyltransferase subunit 2